MGEELLKLRKSKGLSQSKLAQLAGMKQAQLSAIELGKLEADVSLTKKLIKIINSLSEEEIKKLKKKQIRHGGVGIQRKRKDIKFKGQPLKFSTSNLTAISLFAGCGGKCLGFANAGFNILGYVEIEEAFRQIYELNFPTTKCLGTDITKIKDEEIMNWPVPEAGLDILLGGPPCQGFSLVGKRDRDDKRNRLFHHMLRIAQILQPRYVVMENVKLLTSMKAPDKSFVKDNIITLFTEIGYRVEYRELNAQDYGVPQCRERVFFIATRKDLPDLIPTFPAPTHGNIGNVLPLFGSKLRPIQTFRDATGDLEKIGSGEEATNDPLHFAVDHPSHVIEWLRHTPEGCSAHDNKKKEHRPPSGYNTTYKRLRWDEPGATIQTTFGMISASRTVHPEQHRSLTIREAMRIQTFPDNFSLVGNLGKIRTAIGNAVPPLFAQAIAAHIRDRGTFARTHLQEKVYRNSQLVG